MGSRLINKRAGKGIEVGRMGKKRMAKKRMGWKGRGWDWEKEEQDGEEDDGEEEGCLNSLDCMVG